MSRLLMTRLCELAKHGNAARWRRRRRRRRRPAMMAVGNVRWSAQAGSRPFGLARLQLPLFSVL